MQEEKQRQRTKNQHIQAEIRKDQHMHKENITTENERSAHARSEIERCRMKDQHMEEEKHHRTREQHMQKNTLLHRSKYPQHLQTREAEQHR